ncbi:MAG TPA: putative Fe-S cluster assembly protein SufT [Thermodesulfobacteriota bacterium]
MATYERITLSRDVEAIEIPAGTPVTIPAGTGVTLLQSLGGTYTVQTDFGYMVRIDAKDADALGKSAAAARADLPPLRGEDLEAAVWEQLATCYDPEIPVNIVELGLVYRCDIKPVEGGSRVEIDITLTAPGCGMGPVLENDVRQKVASLPGVAETEVNVVLEPAWHPGRMSEAARLELGMM